MPGMMPCMGGMGGNMPGGNMPGGNMPGGTMPGGMGGMPGTCSFFSMVLAGKQWTVYMFKNHQKS